MRFFYSLFFACVIGGLSFAVYLFAFQRLEQSATQISTERLSLYQAGLRSTLDRVAHLPHVVALHPNTREVLRQGKSIAQYNEYLKAVNDKAGAAALYLLNRDGTTIAASNFDNEESFVGNNYRFRRYYSDAIENRVGNFFAVGVTTGRPGYFLSEAIIQGDEALGVAVVKVEFIELLEYWKEARENVLITNKDDVVVLSSNPELLYKMLGPVSETRLAEMKESRKFAQYELEPLSFASGTGAFEGRVELGNSTYSIATADTAKIGWKLHFLTPLDGVHTSALAIASFAFLLCGLAGVGYLYARGRVEQSKLEIVAVEAERVHQANQRLEKEIAERRRTEEQLRDTQSELIQSSRLAALGKMSAAIVHEVNQPVSAIRTYTSSGLLLLKKRRSKDASDVFAQIAKMTERLGSITSDLLVFSRKPVAEPRPVDINGCIRTIVEEFGPQLDDAGVKAELDLWNRPLPVTGSEHRFEQLVSNLLRNAIQACEKGSDPNITLTTIATPTSAIMMISDNGVGIDKEFQDNVFDPFFTTKEVGKGVGLGLALSYAIVDEAGGRIRCENREGGGALFTVEMPIYKSEEINRPKASADGI